MRFFTNTKKKLYTHVRGDDTTIVSSGYKWVNAKVLELSTDLRGDKMQLLIAIKNKEFYYHYVHWSDAGQPEKIARVHANYLLEEITYDDYKEVSLLDARSIFKKTLASPDFHSNFHFNKQFIKEANELFEISFSDKDYFLWFDKPIRPQRTGFAGYFDFWTEFIACNSKSMVYLTIGED